MVETFGSRQKTEEIQIGGNAIEYIVIIISLANTLIIMSVPYLFLVIFAV